MHYQQIYQQKEGRFCDKKVREDSALQVLFKSDSSDRGADAGGNPLNKHTNDALPHH